MPTRLRTQHGVSMIESLVALLVLAIGIMGLAGLQTRSLIETRLTNARANALLLANDLTERMRLNRAAALGDAPYTTNANTWNDALPAVPDGTCRDNPCTPAQLRDMDLREWRILVTQLLPGGQARIEAPVNDQIRVTFRWRNTLRGSEFAAPDESDRLTAPMAVAVGGCQSEEDRRNWVCHQVFIRP